MTQTHSLRRMACKDGDTKRETDPKKMEVEILELCYRKPRDACGHQELKEERKDPPLQTSEKAWSHWHLDLRFLAFRTVKEQISPVSIQFLILCYDSPRKRLQVVLKLNEKKKGYVKMLNKEYLKYSTKSILKMSLCMRNANIVPEYAKPQN